MNRTIPLFNNLFDLLLEFREEHEYDTELTNAVDEAVEKLSKYYRKTDESPVYSIATMLDPMLKFHYWTDEDWEHDIAEEQRNICKKGFKDFLRMKYNQLASSPTETETTTRASVTRASTSTTTLAAAASSSATTEVVESSFSIQDDNDSNEEDDTIVMFTKKRRIANATIYPKKRNTGAICEQEDEFVNRHYDELKAYINLDEKEDFPAETLTFRYDPNTEFQDVDNLQEFGYDQRFENNNFTSKNIIDGYHYTSRPLTYWQRNKNAFPYLSEYASIYLAIPSTSVASERLFSVAKRSINNQRPRLDPELGEKLVLLKKWERELLPN